MSLKGPTKLTENNLAQLNSQGLSLGPCDGDEDSNSKKRSATTKSAPESATLKPVMGLPKQPVDAFAKLRSLLRQKAAKKNTSPSAVGKSTRNVSPVPKFGSRSQPVKLEFQHFISRISGLRFRGGFWGCCIIFGKFIRSRTQENNKEEDIG